MQRLGENACDLSGASGGQRAAPLVCFTVSPDVVERKLVQTWESDALRPNRHPSQEFLAMVGLNSESAS
ncbi:MAG: hypothetical protein HC839_04965 [Leptolyngbyaceae cyanobacterium RM2_2_21]|nr:hypothetical protein [Leptolyngbyaceae cyanobacterium RM2_2_21]NJN01213.1 hypothetical protein [Leptolyngbyaceae cyanobacterium RM1_1_2]